MKRLIIAVLAALLLAPMADAQIQFKKEPSLETIKSLRMGEVRLSKLGEKYVLIIFSDNRYDKPYVILLGEKKENAVKSLEDFIQLAENMKGGEAVSFVNLNQEIRVFRGTLKGEIWFKQDGFAGFGKISKVELNSLLDRILFYNQQ